MNEIQKEGKKLEKTVAERHAHARSSSRVAEEISDVVFVEKLGSQHKIKLNVTKTKLSITPGGTAPRVEASLSFLRRRAALVAAAAAAARPNVEFKTKWKRNFQFHRITQTASVLARMRSRALALSAAAV